MTPQEINRRLKEKRVTQADIADRCGVRASGVNQVIHRRSRSKKIEKSLARTLGVKLAELFGERTDGLDEPLSPRARIQRGHHLESVGGTGEDGESTKITQG
jgi:transcriptional regulator with XRE-family HTH domain